MPNFSFFPNIGCILNASLCNFDSSLTTAGSVFTILVAAGILFSYILLKKRNLNPVKHLAILGLGVLLFELFTAPMWNSFHLGSFSYFYNDLSITLTLGWIAIFSLSMILIDSLVPKLSRTLRFFLYLVPITAATAILENLLVWSGIRSYAPEVIATSIGSLGSIPIEVFYYAPVFGTLVLSFYFAWTTKEKKSSLHTAFTKGNLVSSAVLLAIGITLYELLIEPVVHTPGFPAWSYFYLDISFIRIALWVVMIYFGMMIGGLLLKGKHAASTTKSFLVYLFSSALVFYVVEVMMLTNQSRMYTESVTSNFTGLTLPVVGTPIEVVLAIFIYLTLIVSFLKYWRSVLVKK